ncbi:MAG: hypothetical protein DME97_10905 [Verrucomicrobia bacterium]|nr:MAG: hypothetical protein DME97_10905 [Verrucomicrobiota bacterium]
MSQSDRDRAVSGRLDNQNLLRRIKHRSLSSGYHDSFPNSQKSELEPHCQNFIWSNENRDEILAPARGNFRGKSGRTPDFDNGRKLLYLDERRRV